MTIPTVELEAKLGTSLGRSMPVRQTCPTEGGYEISDFWVFSLLALLNLLLYLLFWS